MLISQEVHGQAPPAQGSAPSGLAELRRQLAEPSALCDGNRQRLLELARRLARVRTLGDEYVRVGFSDGAMDALAEPEAVA